jgi:hypothetical protein
MLNAIAATIILALADSPTPPASPAPQSAPVWHNPVGTRYSIFDPCGGAKELLNKINPSPCVLISGQAMVAGGYSNVITNGSVSVTGPIRNGINLPISGNANIYPNLLMAFGVSPSSQLQISLPSSVNINTQRFGTANASCFQQTRRWQVIRRSTTSRWIHTKISTSLRCSDGQRRSRWRR